MSDNELNTKHQSMTSEEYNLKYPRVMARLPRDLSKLFGEYMNDNGHDQVSPALKEIISRYLHIYYKKNKC